MKSLFDPNVHSEIQSRIESLTPDTTASWGKMSVGQMCTHCQKPLELSMGKIGLSGKKPGFMKRMVFKLYKPLMYNDKPWSKNLPTVRDFVVADEKDVAAEKAKLSALVTEFHQQKDTTQWPAHPMFGKFTHEQWGKMQYKHLDHHLTQFGV
ncbi:DUF1569 domain-containing protein [Kordia algicida OT-1]|uniref:DUF1569 domain-containing protein n=1 Tax=Kordia algicida OT-1 TaxID=391587 RepID=A9DJ00_9FLAO|nr:DUF1569 domain-containing protein [Kordia algicida]EDP97998.1 hypothetical protein KAOT1_12312 [Kordia algicida OT-1]